MKKKNADRTKFLTILNAVFIFIVIILNIVTAFITNGEKGIYTFICAFFVILLLFFYNNILHNISKKNLLSVKKEILYINYPLRFVIFFLLLCTTFVFSFFALYFINKSAANITFAFMFFFGILSLIFPSFAFAVTIYFIYPSVIIPGYTKTSIEESDKSRKRRIFLALFIFFSAYILIGQYLKIKNMNTRNTYKTATMRVGYSTKYLTISPKIDAYSKKKMSKDKVQIPYLYTVDSFSFPQYEQAEEFCESMNARIPNYLEMYYIIFNRFESFGDKYYWTSDKAGTKHVVIHFKNMSFSAEKLPEDVMPKLYCVSDIETRNGRFKPTPYFIRNIEEEKPLLMDLFKSNTAKSSGNADSKENRFDVKNKEQYDSNYSEEINTEKKHIIFSVKEVPSDMFNNLISAGYDYGESAGTNGGTEVNDNLIKMNLNKDLNNHEIRLCYYPFTDYTGLTMEEESQIWQQSFCSPAFTLINPVAELKPKQSKDAYCYAQGGRLPNIPELYGILKIMNADNMPARYWTNNHISDTYGNNKRPIIIQNIDGKFSKINFVNSSENESAYVYCVKQADKPSKVIANYKSRFHGIRGNNFAENICENCEYYEVPDVIKHK